MNKKIAQVHEKQEEWLWGNFKSFDSMKVNANIKI